MLQAPQPPAGHYLDSAGTLYAAHRHKSAGWLLQRLQGRFGDYADGAAFAYEQFPQAVRNGLFNHIPKTTI